MAAKRKLNFDAKPQPAASTAKGAVQKRKRHADFTTEDTLKIAKALLYLGPLFNGRRRNSSEVPVGNNQLFRRLKVLLGYEHHPDSIRKHFNKWRLGNTADWEAMKQEAEAEGEAYFHELAKLEKELIERGELDDNRQDAEHVNDASAGDEHRSEVGQPMESHEPWEGSSSQPPQQEADVSGGTAYIRWIRPNTELQPENTEESDGKEDDEEEGDGEEGGLDHDEHEEEERVQPSRASEQTRSPRVVHNHYNYHFHGPVTMKKPGGRHHRRQ